MENLDENKGAPLIDEEFITSGRLYDLMIGSPADENKEELKE